MYRIIDESAALYALYNYDDEDEFEAVIIENAESVFGTEGIYFDIKKLIGKPKKGAAIPDGYYLDLTFHNAPRLYLVEVELQTHDVYGHIGEQILRFGISSERKTANETITNRSMLDLNDCVRLKTQSERSIEAKAALMA